MDGCINVGRQIGRDVGGWVGGWVGCVCVCVWMCVRTYVQYVSAHVNAHTAYWALQGPADFELGFLQEGVSRGGRENPKPV